jgi:hypothetical protein
MENSAVLSFLISYLSSNLIYFSDCKFVTVSDDHLLTCSLCSGAEFLLRIVHEAIPDVYFEFGASVPAADLAVHVLDYLHKKLEEMCLVQGGEVVNLFLAAHYAFLHIFLGS